MGGTGAVTVDLEELSEGTSLGALLFRLNPDTISVFRQTADGGLEVRAVNDALLGASGWTPEDVVGLRLEQLLHPAVVDALMVHYTHLQAPGDVSQFEVAAEVPAGRRSYDVTMIRLEDQDGVPHCMTVSHDVTGPRDVAEALAETQEIAHIGHWSWDLETGDLRSTDEVRRMYGIALDDSVLDVELFWERVHPDDEPRVREEIADALDGHRRWESEYRVLGTGDAVRLILGRGMAVRGIDGEPLRLAGTVQDITERRETELIAQRAALVEVQQRQALELNDDVVQGLATTRLALMSGDQDLALDILDRTIESARGIITGLLAAKVEGGISPGDMVRDRSAAGFGGPTDPRP